MLSLVAVGRISSHGEIASTIGERELGNVVDHQRVPGRQTSQAELGADGLVLLLELLALTVFLFFSAG